jgi:putative peptidoglycan lipid II flippase
MSVTIEVEQATTPVPEAPVEPLSQAEQVVQSAGIVSASVVVSRISGLLREMVMAYAFGAGFRHDAFLLGFRIPNLSRDLFAEGALASSFIPTFTHSLVKADKRDADELARQLTSLILVVVGTFCVLGMIFAPQLVSLLAPGFAMQPEKFDLAVRLTRIMFPFLLLIALSTQAMGMLNAQGSFGIPATASIFFNAGAVGFGLLLGYVVGPHIGLQPIEGMAYGIVAGGFMQLAWQLPRLRSMGFRLYPAWRWTHPGIRRIGRLMLPAVISSLAMQINLVVNTSFASRLSDPIRGANGPVSWLGYSLRFVQFPMGVFAVAFASAMLPSVSRSAAAKDFNEFRKTTARSLTMVFLLTIPSALLLMVLGKAMIGAVYQSGHFVAYDTQQTAIALACYAAGLVSFASARVLTPAFYALSDARTPMYLTLLSIFANVALPLFLLDVMNMSFAAMALTTSIAMTLESACLFEGLRRKLGGLEGRILADRFVRIVAAGMVMALPLAIADWEFTRHFEATRLTYLCELLFLAPLGVVLFAATAKLFAVEELESATNFFLTPLRRRIFGARDKVRVNAG